MRERLGHNAKLFPLEGKRENGLVGCGLVQQTLGDEGAKLPAQGLVPVPTLPSAPGRWLTGVLVPPGQSGQGIGYLAILEVCRLDEAGNCFFW